MTRVRVGLAGCGEVARRGHLPALLANPAVEVTALCDIDDAQVAEVKRRFSLGCPSYRELDEMLAAKQVEAVHICTPGQTHAALARRAIDAGVHVLLEKPPALCTGDAQDLVDLASARGVKVGVVLNTRWRDTTLALKDALDRGRLGEIVKIQITHHANIVFSENPALWDERKSKYLVYEFGIHFLDLMVYLCGPHAEVLYVLPTYRDSVEMTTGLDIVIRFGTGALGLLDITCDSTRHSSYLTHVNVFGTGMDAFVRYFPSSFRLAAGLHNPLEILKTEIVSTFAILWRVLTNRYRASRNQSHKLVIDSFVNSLKNGEDFATELVRVLPTMRLLDEVASQVPAYATTDHRVKQERTP